MIFPPTYMYMHCKHRLVPGPFPTRMNGLGTRLNDKARSQCAQLLEVSVTVCSSSRMRRLGFAVVTLLLQLAVCEDYFWLHNSNWDEPNNWSLGRVPCGGQNVSFAAVSREYSVKTAADSTVHLLQK